MISGPRIVAIDDNVEHLQTLQQGFDRLGGHCVALEYSKALERKSHFRTGVRLVFMDINLLPGSGSALGPRTFDPVVVALRKTLSCENGPYALITWTNMPDNHQALVAYLRENLDPQMVPAADHCLPKGKFLADPDELEKELVGLNFRMPGFGLLMDWERMVSEAADMAVSEVFGLGKGREENSDGSVANLGINIGVAAVGTVRANEYPFHSFVMGMSSVLADRLDHVVPDSDVEGRWAAKLRPYRGVLADWDSKAKLNSFFNVTDVIGASSAPGTVYELRVRDLAPYFSKEQRSGIAAMTSKEFVPIKEQKESKEQVGRLCKWRFVRIGAACDYANGKDRVVEGHAAVEVPESCFASTMLKYRKQFPDTPKNHNWLFQTPPFYWKGETRVLVINLRFRMSFPKRSLTGFRPVYRLREELSSEIALHSANFGTRPGIEEFR